MTLTTCACWYLPSNIYSGQFPPPWSIGTVLLSSLFTLPHSSLYTWSSSLFYQKAALIVLTWLLRLYYSIVLQHYIICTYLFVLLSTYAHEGTSCDHLNEPPDWKQNYYHHFLRWMKLFLLWILPKAGDFTLFLGLPFLCPVEFYRCGWTW